MREAAEREYAEQEAVRAAAGGAGAAAGLFSGASGAQGPPPPLASWNALYTQPLPRRLRPFWRHPVTGSTVPPPRFCFRPAQRTSRSRSSWRTYRCRIQR